MNTNYRKKPIMFPKRILEPKTMGEIELNVFNEVSASNYARWFVPLVDDVLKHAGRIPGQILDVACGPGLLIKELARRSDKSFITGVDNSYHAIKLAKKNNASSKNISLKVGDVYKLPLPDNFFDIVICKDSFHHFENSLNALKEMVRVLRKGGLIYIQDLRRDMPQYLLRRCIPPDSIFKKLQFYSARAALTKTEIVRLFRRVDLRFVVVSSRLVSDDVRERYARLGIDINLLKEGFQTRYVAVARKPLCF